MVVVVIVIVSSVCVCVGGMVKVITFLLKLNSLGLLSRVYGTCVMSEVLKRKCIKNNFFLLNLDKYLCRFAIITLSPIIGVVGRCGPKRVAQ